MVEAWSRQFNIYLTLVATLALVCGCETDRPRGPVATLRVHLEASPDSSGTTQTISVLRAAPVLITIGQQPVLTEANIVAAKVVAVQGGFAIQVHFDETGSWILEQYTAANTGRHFAIFGQWSDQAADSRWLAAPLITHRIGTGVLVFTPDLSRLEADQLVIGLSNVAQFHLKQLQ